MHILENIQFERISHDSNEHDQLMRMYLDGLMVRQKSKHQVATNYCQWSRDVSRSEIEVLRQVTNEEIAKGCFNYGLRSCQKTINLSVALLLISAGMSAASVCLLLWGVAQPYYYLLPFFGFSFALLGLFVGFRALTQLGQIRQHMSQFAECRITFGF